MAKRREVVGAERIKAKLLLYGKKKLKKIELAVKQSGVNVLNDAKANHVRGQAHAVGRYEDQTPALTPSMETELTVATEEEITAEVFTVIEYAFFVEVTHPYLFPALQANRDDFVARVKRAME